MRRLLPLLLLASLPAVAAEPAKLPQVELGSDARREIANDLAQATLFIETSDADPAVIARRIDRVTADALKTAGRYPQVKSESGMRNTWPLYDNKSGKQTGWRGRAEIRLESRDSEKLARLIGELQPSLQLSGLGFAVSDASRKATEDALIPEALKAFQNRAQLAAKALGFANYRVVDVSVNGGGGQRPVPYYREAKMLAAPAMADSAPTLAPGTSELTVNVRGKVELY